MGYMDEFREKISEIDVDSYPPYLFDLMALLKEADEAIEEANLKIEKIQGEMESVSTDLESAKEENLRMLAEQTAEETEDEEVTLENITFDDIKEREDEEGSD